MGFNARRDALEQRVSRRVSKRVVERLQAYDVQVGDHQVARISRLVARHRREIPELSDPVTLLGDPQTVSSGPFTLPGGALADAPAELMRYAIGADREIVIAGRLVVVGCRLVIVLLHAPDPAFVREASKRGVFAHISDTDVEDWQSAIDIVLRRFTEYHDLRGAFGRRALIERAKGILMERHSVDDDTAFEMLRERSRTANRKLVDLATAVVDGHGRSRGCLRRLSLDEGRSPNTRHRRLMRRRTLKPRAPEPSTVGSRLCARPTRTRRHLGDRP